MSINDFKIYAINFSAMALSFANIETYLKIILLLVSIVYTVMKTIELIKNKDDNKADNS